MLGGLAVLRCCAINMQQLSLQGRAGGDNALVWSSTVPMCDEGCCGLVPHKQVMMQPL